MDFEELLEWSIDEVRQAGGHRLHVPPDMADQRVRDTRMRTLRLGLPERGEFRAVSIEGKKVHIINMFLWPDPRLDAPSYAMEFVVFGPRPIVGVVDLIGLCGPASEARAQTVLEAAHRRFALEPGADPPEWYQQCRSGHDFFVRPADRSAVATLQDVHRSVFTASLDALRTAQAASSPGEHHEALAAYKRHHRENTPGLPWLVRSFGEPWARRYLEDCVFA